jgi:CMP-N-acetylneuraminic acid synthetase
MMNTIAIIPARGNSKRLLRKNIREFYGKPLIEWTIRAALLSKEVDGVYVSTEDSEISKIARDSGAQVLERPDWLSTDKSTCAEVCHYHLQDYWSSQSKPENLLCLYATAPLRNERDIDNMISMMSEKEASAVIAVTEFSHSPHQAFAISGKLEIQPFWPDLCRKRSNDLPTFVAGNGSSYLVKTSAFNKYKDFYHPDMPGVFGYNMPLCRSIDINTEDDFEMLSIIARYARFESG